MRKEKKYVDPNNFGGRLREARRHAGLTQKELANEFFINPKTYSKYETESIEMPYDLLIATSKKLNVSIDYLLTGHEFSTKDNLNNDFRALLYSKSSTEKKAAYELLNTFFNTCLPTLANGE